MKFDATTTNRYESAPIDRSIFRILAEDIADNDPVTMLELIDLFVNDSGQHIREISQGVEKQNIRTIEMGAHSVKSTAATFGAMTLSVLCAQIEQLAYTKEIDDIDEILELAYHEFLRVEAELSVERKKWMKVANL